MKLDLCELTEKLKNSLERKSKFVYLLNEEIKKEIKDDFTHYFKDKDLQFNYEHQQEVYYFFDYYQKKYNIVYNINKYYLEKVFSNIEVKSVKIINGDNKKRRDVLLVEVEKDYNKYIYVACPNKCEDKYINNRLVYNEINTHFLELFKTKEEELLYKNYNIYIDIFLKLKKLLDRESFYNIVTSSLIYYFKDKDFFLKLLTDKLYSESEINGLNLMENNKYKYLYYYEDKIYIK